MVKLIFKLGTDQVIEMLQNLDAGAKIEIVKSLEDDVWGKRLDNLIKRLTQRAKGRVSLRQIIREVDEVRGKNYADRS